MEPVIPKPRNPHLPPIPLFTNGKPQVPKPHGKDAPSRTIATGVVNNLSSQTACQVVTHNAIVGPATPVPFNQKITWKSVCDFVIQGYLLDGLPFMVGEINLEVIVVWCPPFKVGEGSARMYPHVSEMLLFSTLAPDLISQL